MFIPLEPLQTNSLKLGEDSVSVLLGAGLTTEVSGNSLALSDSLRCSYQHFELVEEPRSSTYRKSGLLDLVGELVKTHVSVNKQVSHATSQRMCMVGHDRIQGGDNNGRVLFTYRSIINEERRRAVGFARPLPSMSGAEP